MKKSILTTTIILLFVLIGCTTPPPSPESSAVQVEESAAGSNEPQVAQPVDGPVATAAIVISGESTNQEGYPPPAQTVAEGYPEPVGPAQVAEGYPEPAEESAPAADIALQQPPAIAGDGDVQILFVSARSDGDNSWNFAVTLEHADTGWEDYADGWDVVLPDGTIIKPNADSPFTRLLLHPHENEQPFTRSQAGIIIPAEVTTVFVRAHELVEGYSSQVMAIDLTAEGGEGYEVIR